MKCGYPDPRMHGRLFGQPGGRQISLMAELHQMVSVSRLTREVISPLGTRSRRIRGIIMSFWFGFCSIGGTRRQRSNVPFPSRDLFPLGAPPTDRASFDLWIGPSTSARFGEAPTLTCARQAALPIDATLPCCACRRASRPEPAIGSRTSLSRQHRPADNHLIDRAALACM